MIQFWQMHAGMMEGNIETSEIEEERAEMQEGVTKESQDGDDLLHDVCGIVSTSVCVKFRLINHLAGNNCLLASVIKPHHEGEFMEDF